MVAQLALTRPHSNSAATLHHFDTLRITGCSESYQNVALPCQRLQRYHFTFKMKVLIPQAFIFFSSTPFYVYSFFTVQLNHYETDLLFRYLSHHLTWHYFWVFPGFPSFCFKIVLHWYGNQNKINHVAQILGKSWEIVRNQITISCQIITCWNLIVLSDRY